MLYPKDTEKWKQFTTGYANLISMIKLCCIPKILKNESNSQRRQSRSFCRMRCVVSQRYWKMKAIHNDRVKSAQMVVVVLYPKDTEKWKQFTTNHQNDLMYLGLCCIPKILKNESNSQLIALSKFSASGCVVSQRYWKMKAIHNITLMYSIPGVVVLYPKDTEKWKQFTTSARFSVFSLWLCCIPKILKNESNSQLIIG